MAQKKKIIINGVNAANEIDPNNGIRDVRTNGTKFKAFMLGEGGFILIIMFLLIISIETVFALLGKKTMGISVWLILAIPIVKLVSEQITILPFKKPEVSGELDINQRHPVTGEATKAKGISFFGNSAATGDQIWFSDSDLRTHCLIFGTTGAGKTETLLSLCMNSLIHASGFIYIDGKGDNSLFVKIFSMLRRTGREDDVLFINYMTGSVDTTKKSFGALSNTMNPFSEGTRGALSELLISLLPSGGDGMWKGRASIFITALISTLVYLRNERKILLDIETIREYFAFNKIEELTLRTDIPREHKAGLVDYIYNLPSYVPPDPSKPNEVVQQESDVYLQHGFITMQFTESFGLLADTYGHIMKTQLAEIDMYDVVINRRILVVLLPALEKSPQNLCNLGKIIVASIKGMMSVALGSNVEGYKKDVIDAKPTNAKSPYLTVFDEYGYYATEGAEVMPAQARGLGFQMIFAGQDYQAFKKGSEQGAASIVANCAIKICMKLEDPTETCDIFVKAAGEANVSLSGGLKQNTESVTGAYVDTGQANVSKMSRINPRDLKAQEAGEAHILFGDVFERIKTFYANPKQVEYQKLNKFLSVPMPTYESIKSLTQGYNKIKQNFEKSTGVDTAEDFAKNVHSLSSDSLPYDLLHIFKAFKFAKSDDLQVKAMFALYAHIKRLKIEDNKLIDDKEAIERLNTVENEFEDDYYDDDDDDDDSSSGFNVPDLNYEEFNQPEQIVQSDNDMLSVREEVAKKLKSRNETKETNINGTSNIDLLRKKIQEKHKDMEKFASQKYNPYKEMNMDIKTLQSDMKLLERELNHNFNKKGLLDDNMTDPDLQELTTENLIVNMGLNAANYPGEIPLKSRKENADVIKGIIADIIVPEID